ncbi:TonB-dependent receptor [Sphingomonas aerolata]|uniref:TonB-dependent receptor domain-containing protein n=1 Tax=Sphingomonas aerolata TaxID=185951 RepID=UPI002FDFA221
MLDATFDDFISGGSSFNGNTPPDVPETLANFWLRWNATHAVQARAGLRYVGRRYSNDANSFRVPSYTTVDATLSYAVTPRLAVDIHGYNLFDRAYALARTTISSGSLAVPARLTFHFVPAFNALRRPELGKTARRWLYLIHRWIGIASCLFFAMWFLSGLVMLYVPYPSLSPAEKLVGSEAIDWAAVNVPPPLDGGRLHAGAVARDARRRACLARDRVGWNAHHFRGQSRYCPATGRCSLRRSGRWPLWQRTDEARRTADPGSVDGCWRLDRHRPLWKVALANASGTEAYVSSNTGAVVQVTTRRERFWNWLGSVPHWLYPTVLRRDQTIWRQVVLWASGPCIAAAVAGMWIGIPRTRIGARRFKGGRTTPYDGWMLWHHVAGLVGGIFLIAWIFSGWLSVDPGHLFRGTKPDDAAVRIYQASDPMPDLALDRLRIAGRGCGCSGVD